jgi:GT2 family glycosyltransferase/glycosyltransferase involved in cell wall biosynthesis
MQGVDVVSYSFKEAILSDGKIIKQKPKKVTPTQGRVAIIAHIFYIDLWSEIEAYLDKLNISYDLYVTVPHIMANDDIKKLFSKENINVFVSENRGRDVLPFLLTMEHIGVDSYKYICKLHTKKTGDSPLGNVWRKLLYFDLLEAESATKSLEILESDQSIGQITGRNTILDSKRYAYGNNSKIKFLCNELNIEFKEEYTFCGGTMFWSRTSTIAPLVELFKKDRLKFEEERGQKDHTIAHAIERLFGILLQNSNQSIAPSPSDYSKLPTQTVEETASLVLSQQYAGESIYEYIHHLEELTESMRLKNRLKRLPNSSIEFAKKRLFFFGNKARNIDIKVASAKFKKLKKINPATLKKLTYYIKRGEFKYLASKVAEKVKHNLFSSKDYVNIDLNNYFCQNQIDYNSALGSRRIDIVIPVYNGYEYLEPLFASIKANTSHPYRLIVVNDASPDNRVKELLSTILAEFEDVEFIDNEQNLGFVKSVNKAVKLVEADFVILNTDTEVPPMWLQKLMYPIKNMPKVATTTPFTNSGTIASFPRFLEDNTIFENLPLNSINKHFSEVNAKEHYAKAPTGVGFCMGVNYALVKEIGFFDEESFSKGYGEENDWCQRAIQKGYSNLIVPNLYVYHKHGGSFSSELKQKLLHENQQKLLQKHPTYNKQVQEYVANNPHKVLRELLVITTSSQNKPLFVVFDHSLGGGANSYLDNLLKDKIAQNENTLLIRYDFYTNNYKCNYKYEEYEFKFAVDSLDNLDILLSRANIKELFLNSFVSYPNQKELLEYINSLCDKDIEITLPLHDYFAICPSYTLLNSEGSYCGMPSKDVCKTCLANNNQEWKNFFNDEIDIETWRELWIGILNRAKVLVFSNASRDILTKAYPTLNTENIEVIPHIVDDIAPVSIPKRAGSKVTIGVLGAINYAKGASVIKELVDKIEKENLDIDVVVVGQITEQINSKHFKFTGKYKREELKGIILNSKIDIFLIPSIWPETFSYTTEEIIKMNIPLMVFNLGAPAERVKEYKNGYILDNINADSIVDCVKELSSIN